MNTKIYLLSFTIGLNATTTTIYTSDPLGTVMQLAAKGHHLEHVTYKAVPESETAAAAEQMKTEQNWQFMEYS